MECPKERPRFAYIGPTYTQAKTTAWDYAKHFAAPVLDHDTNESELRIDYHSNHSRLRLFGADNPDSLRGNYFDGVVLDESSILKHQDSKTRKRLIEACSKIPYRLSCTATPAWRHQGSPRRRSLCSRRPSDHRRADAVAP